MDSNKRTHVIDLIKKSLSLGVSEDEIINTLSEANLSKEEAIDLIKEAKNQTQKIEAESIKFKKNDYSKTNNLSIGDQISRQLGLEKDEGINNNSIKVNLDNKHVQKDDLINKDNNVDNQKEKTFDFGIKVKSKSNSTSGSSKSFFSRLSKPIKKNESINFKQANIENVVDEKNEEIKQSQKDERKEGASENNSEKINLVSDESSNDPMDFVKKNFPNNNLEKSENKFESKKIFDETTRKISSGEITKDSAFEEMWKKGIVVAVNAKLNEMRKLKDDIDMLLSQKVDEAVKKETKQFSVLFNSQKDLIISSNKEALEQKQKEISLIIDSKINEVKKQAVELSNNIKIIEDSKKSKEDMLAELENVLNEAKKTKSQLLVEMNSEIIKSKSSAQEFIDRAQLKMDELDEKINNSLELEKNIAEGIIEEAQQRIESLAIARADELIGNLEVELNKLKTATKTIDLDRIEQKVKLLDEFKKQFLDSMEENISRMNESIKELNTKNEVLSEELEQKSLAIDAKIEELTKFEKLFTQNLENILNKNKN